MWLGCIVFAIDLCFSVFVKLDFARIFYVSVSKNHFIISGAAESISTYHVFFSSDAIWGAQCLLFDISGPHFGISGASWAVLEQTDLNWTHAHGGNLNQSWRLLATFLNQAWQIRLRRAFLFD